MYIHITYIHTHIYIHTKPTTYIYIHTTHIYIHKHTHSTHTDLETV